MPFIRLFNNSSLPKTYLGKSTRGPVFVTTCYSIWLCGLYLFCYKSFFLENILLISSYKSFTARFATSLLLKIGIFFYKKGLFMFKVLLTDSFFPLNCGKDYFVSTFGSSKTFKKLNSVYILWMCLSETANWYFLHSSISSVFVNSSHSSIFYYLFLPNFFITPSSLGY